MRKKLFVMLSLTKTEGIDLLKIMKKHADFPAGDCKYDHDNSKLSFSRCLIPVVLKESESNPASGGPMYC